MARWIEEDNGVWCSECEAFFFYDEEKNADGYPFCPMCGSQMEGNEHNIFEKKGDKDDNRGNKA